MRRLDTNSGHDFDGENAEESGCVSGGIGDGDGDGGDGKEEDEDESGSGGWGDSASGKCFDNEGRDEEREDESGSGGQDAAKEDEDGWGTILP